MQLIIKDDKLQKYRDHVQIGKDLFGKDKEMFDRYFFAFSQLLDGLSERKVVELLMFCPAHLGRLRAMLKRLPSRTYMQPGWRRWLKSLRSCPERWSLIIRKKLKMTMEFT